MTLNSCSYLKTLFYSFLKQLGVEMGLAMEKEDQKRNFYFSISEAFSTGSVSKKSTCRAGDPGSVPGLGRWTREGNGTPRQHSWLESPMDRGVSRATVHSATRGEHEVATKPPPVSMKCTCINMKRCLKVLTRIILSSVSKRAFKLYHYSNYKGLNMNFNLCVIHVCTSRQTLGNIPGS